MMKLIQFQVAREETEEDTAEDKEAAEVEVAVEVSNYLWTSVWLWSNISAKLIVLNVSRQKFWYFTYKYLNSSAFWLIVIFLCVQASEH